MVEPIVTEKTCPKCCRTLPAFCFYRSSRSKDGLQWMCKDCARPFEQKNTVRKKTVRRSARKIRQEVRDKELLEVAGIQQQAVKECTKCCEIKPLTEFHKKGTGRTGIASVHGECKNCAHQYYLVRIGMALPIPKPAKGFCPLVEKLCTRCGTVRPLSEFRVRKRKTGHKYIVSWCKSCGYVESRKLSQTPERRATAKTYRSTPTCRAAIARCNERYKQTGKDLKDLYNLSIEEYQTMLQKQDGCCAICQQAPTRKRLSVDHDHSNGKVRGLLCNSCNLALGNFKDSLTSLARAYTYLLNQRP